MDIRSEQLADLAAVRRVHTAAFSPRGQVVAALVDDLRQLVTAVSGVSLVAVERGEVVAHVLFTPGLLDAPRSLVSIQVLSPLAVLPAFQGQGIGAALVAEGLAVMAKQSAPLVFLEGDPLYYSRFGFRAGGDLGFRRPSLRIPKPAFQSVTLPSYESWMTGTLVYPDAFWQHDLVGLRDADL